MIPAISLRVMLAQRLSLFRSPILPARGSREWYAFLACLAVCIAGLYGAVRLNGLALLLLLSIIAEWRIITQRTILLAAMIGLVKLLRWQGNWYLAHSVADFAVIIASLATAALSIPDSLKTALARLSWNRRAILGVALPAFIFQLHDNPTISGGDSLPVLPTVIQMLRHGNRDLAGWCADGRWQPYMLEGRPYFLRHVASRPGLYSAYPAGMELFALPTVLVAEVFNAKIDDPDFLLRLEKICASLVTGAALALFFLLASYFAKPLTAYVATLLLATGSTFTSTTGLALWQQTGVAFWVIVVLLCEARGRNRWLQAFACAMLIACRPSAVTFLVPFGVWLLIVDWRRGLLLPLMSIVCYLPWAIMYQSIYGSPFGPSMSFLDGAWQPGEHLPGVLFSPARGLFIYQPWLALALWQNRQTLHRWWPFLLAAMGIHALLIASWPMWWGGHSYGSRLLAEIVPLAGLLLLKPLESLLECPWGRWLAGGLVVLGLMIHLPNAYGHASQWNFMPCGVDDHPERLWDWRDPPFLRDAQK